MALQALTGWDTWSFGPFGGPDDDGGFPYPLRALQMLGKNDATLIAFDAPEPVPAHA